MIKHERSLLYVFFCIIILPVAHAQNDVPGHAIDGEYINEWLVLGPFFSVDLEKDFLVDVGGEANIEPKEGDTIVTEQGDTLAWKSHQTNRSIIDLLNEVGNYQHATAYAFCTLKSNIKGKNKILLGSYNGLAVWINGKRVHYNPTYRRLFLDHDVFEADLKEGNNRCLVKVSQDIGYWDFAMRAFPHNQEVLVTPQFFLSSDDLKDEIWLPDRFWKYHLGDNAVWANPEFDDSEWETTSTQLRPNKLPKSGWDGIGWFRLHMAVDSTLWNRPLALNVSQWGASEIYLDGRLVAQFGKVGSSKQDEEGFVTGSRIFLPPPQSIVFGNTYHVIAVRFSNFYETEMYPQPPQGFGFGIVLKNLNSAIALSASQKRIITIIQMVLTIVPLVFTILHLLFFLFYPRAKENLYYALFTLTFGALWFVFFQYNLSLVTDSQLVLLFMKLNYALAPLVFIAGLRFSYALFYPILPKQFWIFLMIGVGIGAWKWVQIYSQWYIDWFIMITVLEMLRVVVVAIRRKKDGAWIIGTGFIFFTGAFMWGIAIIENLPSAIALFSFGFFGLLLSMSVYLSRNFARTNKKIVEQEMEQKLLEAENARQSKELEEARKLQLSMLPKELPQLPNLDIGVFMQTATEVGGDYYDFHHADNGTLTVAVGDATGHGMQAGTMVAATKSLFNSLADEPEPVQILKKGTKAIKAMGLKKMFMALTIAKFKDHQMHVSAAGMPFTLVYRASTGQVEELELKGLPLGVLHDFHYQEKKLQLNKDDTVLFLSDGFEEMFNQQGEILGDDKAKKHFEESATSSPEDIIEHLIKAGKAWADGSAQRDDVTFVVVKIK